MATGGQGRYYRRSLVQLVLYRHFIRNAPGLEPWFRTAGLSRIAAQGCVGVPIPDRWTPRFTKDLELLTRVGERVGARVHVLDDRRTPDWVAVKGLPEPGVDEQELLSWRLAAALSSRWPISLGRVVERHDCGGLYDQLQLQGTGDRRLDWPSPRPRVSLNRPGSLWVFSPDWCNSLDLAANLEPPRSRRGYRGGRCHRRGHRGAGAGAACRRAVLR